MDRKAGFTLIELMITLAVAAILVGVALPAFDAMVKNNRRVAAANDFLSTIHIARSEAITRNQRVSLCPTTNGSSCATNPSGWQTGWLVFLDPTNAAQPANADAILTVGDPLRGGLMLVSADFPSKLTIMPNGRVPLASGDDAGILLLCEPGASTPSREIRIARTGRPRVRLESSESCPT